MSSSWTLEWGETAGSYFVLFAADLITAVEFDPTGDYLATGDRGGRVVLFERNEDVGIKNNFIIASSITASNGLR